MLKCSVVTNFDSLHVERFKQSTKEKLRGVRCPDHRQPPRLHFQGDALREITISMSGCCEKLMALANARIAAAAADIQIRKPA
jgi:5'-3' exonuclease